MKPASDNDQRFPDKSWVLLHDDTGEIPDEIAQVLEEGYEGGGMYVVEVPMELRDDPSRDVDGLREVHEDQMSPLVGDGTMTPREPESFEHAVSAYVGCAPLGDVRLGWKSHSGVVHGGWWFFPEDGRVDPFSVARRHAKVADIKESCLIQLRQRFGFKPAR